MPTTTNYGWTIPADTDLVKDGASAIRTLGNAIDTTAAASFGGNLVKINTTSFTTQSSVSLNDVFSATYDNYYILTYLRTSATSGTEIRVRLRSGGTDNTNNWNTLTDWTSNTTLGSGSNNSGVNYGVLCFGGNLVSISHGIITQPFAALNTGIINNSLEQSDSDQYTSTHGAYHSQATSYTGLTIYPAAGTITGKVTIFGMKQ